ncbi:MAG TPA: ribonuclease PH [Opitutaceae bacterium]|nr:ribonuclease PH [Opitutaceae bacterium]
MTESIRPDGRAPDQLREITFQGDVAPNAHGSVLVGFGGTRVICAAMIERGVPGWMRQQGVKGGWLSAEYSMLPYSTLDRKSRDINRGKLDGRTVEIQRLIGRSLRAVIDLAKLGENTLWVDCDVLQADGGTRTAAITGAYLAARMAVDRLIADKRVVENPFTDSVAAVSVGVFDGAEILDLAYLEDKDATVDANIVMTGSGNYVEVQSAGEEAVFSRDQLDRLLILAEGGLRTITGMQNAFLTSRVSGPPAA